MKTRSYTKHLTIEEPATEELLHEALIAYKPTSFKDFFVTCMLHVTAVNAVKRGWLDEPGTYSITDVWFDKDVPWHKVRCQVRKIS
jgi:hypothetical protein